MKKIVSTILLLFLASNVMALVTIGQSKASALEAVQRWKGTLTVNSGNYIEATSFSTAIFSTIIPIKVAFYLNQDNTIYSIVYLLTSVEERNSIAKKLAPLDFDGSKTVSVIESNEYLQLLLGDSQGFSFVLMDSIVARKDAPADYTVLKKTAQAWQNMAKEARIPHHLLGLTLSDLNTIVPKNAIYDGGKVKGTVFLNGERIYGYKVDKIFVVFSPQGKIIQSIWLFENSNEWTRFLRDEGQEADLLLQSNTIMQEALMRGETINYQLNEQTLFRFWVDAEGYGAAFGDKKALK